jgi:uncharacterized protein YhhL (DUF1145 family)
MDRPAVDTSRRTWTLLFLVIAAGMEVFFIQLAYAHMRDERYVWLGVGAVTLALAGIDWFVRKASRGIDARPWYRRWLPLWCTVPFLCALTAGTWEHYQKWQEGLCDIESFATDIHDAVVAKHPGGRWDAQVTAGEIDAAVNTLVKAHSQEPRSGGDGEDAATGAARRLDSLARVLGADLRAEQGRVDLVREAAARDTMASLVLAIAIQALLVMWIPILLAVAISRARVNLLQRIDGAPVGVLPMLDARDRRILAETQALFLPRLCFGVLLVLGTNYVLAPLGLKATAIMSLVDEHALPGHTSWTLWTTSAADVPVIVIGFLGFLVYALITATQRFVQDDLDDQAMLALLVRGLVVILLSFALSASPMNETAARIFVFIAGVFPIRALEAIAKKTNVAIDPDFSSDGPGSFDGLPSLDPAKVFALRAAGIQSSYDLAAMPIEDIARRVRIDPRLLGRAVDRAILIDAMGLSLACELDAFAITSATELVAVKDAIPEAVCAKLGDAAKRVADRLATDPRVETIKSWLAGAVDEMQRRRRPNQFRRVVGEALQHQIDSTLLSREVVDNLQGKTGDDVRQVLVHTAAAMKGKIESSWFLTVDLSEFGITPSKVQLPISAYDDFGDLVDDVYFQLGRKVGAFQYGSQWALTDARGEVIKHAREITGQPRGRSVPDMRSLAEVGIQPGDTLRVVWLVHAAMA